MADITIPKGDYGFNLDFTVQKNDGTVFSLTDYTITMKVWPEGMPSEVTVSGACTPDDAEAGTCHYEVQDGDFDDGGDYLIELELTQEGVIASTRNYTLRVEESA